MRGPYNSGLNRSKYAENGTNRRQLAVVYVLQLTLLIGISCRSNAPQPEPPSQEGTDRAMAGQKIAEAEELYRQRADLSKVRLGVALLRQARVADFGNYDAAWKLAKFNYYLGAHSDDDTERDAAFREGIAAGKSAVELGGDRADGHFWLGANYGGSAEESTLAGLANVEDIRREMEAVLKIDEGYQAGSAYLALGQLYLRAPKILGGDYSKAIDYLEKGLKLGSDNALLRVNLAEAYHAAGRDADAHKQIDFLMSMKSDPDYAPEYNEAVARAKKLLEEMDRR